MSDTETTSTEPDEEAGTTATNAPAAPAKPPKIRSTIDAAGSAVIVEGERYELSKLPGYDASRPPQGMIAVLALAGLRTRMVAAAYRPAAFADMVAGKVKHREPAVERVSPWHQAIAAALVEETKKSPEPLTHEQAAALVKAMSRKKQEAARTDALVIKHYRKITGKKSSLLDIVRAPEEAEASAVATEAAAA